MTRDIDSPDYRDSNVGEGMIPPRLTDRASWPNTATPKPRAGEQADERIAELEEIKRAHVRDIHLLWAERDMLVEALRDLLDRVDRNGGLGEYKGGPAFVTGRARELLDKYGR